MYSAEGYLLWGRTVQKRKIKRSSSLLARNELASWLHFENFEHKMNDALPIDVVFMELASKGEKECSMACPTTYSLRVEHTFNEESTPLWEGPPIRNLRGKCISFTNAYETRLVRVDGVRYLVRVEEEIQ